MQQSTGHLTVNTKTHKALQSVDKLSKVATWLPKHIGLVRTLCLHLEADSPAAADGADSPADTCSPAVTAMLTLALQLCTASHACGARAALDAQHLPAPLRLHHFDTNTLVSGAVLDVLAWASLRELVLSMPAQKVTPRWCAALARLKSLNLLNLTAKGGGMMPPEFAAAVSRLPLDALDLQAAVDVGFAAHLPASLTDSCIDLPVSGDHFDLQHLSALHDLACFGSGAEVILPPQHLNQLLLEGSVQVKGVVSAAHVQLTAKEAAAFAVLPQLRKHASGLHQLIAQCYTQCRPVTDGIDAAWPHALTALGQLTALTRLSWHIFVVDGPSVCVHVAKLQNLVDLALHVCEESWQDIMRLATLTKLISLTFICGCGCTDVAAVALAASLTGLQFLCLRGSMETWGLLPVVARLTDLRACTIRTDIEQDSQLRSLLCPDTLQLLAPLTQCS